MSAVDARAWMRFASVDMAAARLLVEAEGLSGVVAFHAQQCAEKALKAVLVADGREVPRIHDLLVLVRHLPVVPSLPDERALHRLSSYAVESWYPDDIPDIGDDEARAAIETADAVLAAVRLALEG